MIKKIPSFAKFVRLNEGVEEDLTAQKAQIQQQIQQLTRRSLEIDQQILNARVEANKNPQPVPVAENAEIDLDAPIDVEVGRTLD